MKFSKPFTGVKAGDIYPTQFGPGDECPQELLEAAEAEGVLEAETVRRGRKPADKTEDQ